MLILLMDDKLSYKPIIKLIHFKQNKTQNIDLKKLKKDF